MARSMCVPSSRFFSLRLLAVLAILVSGILQAQSFQSSFSEVKFDRSQAPQDWHRGFSVDAATGGLNFKFPLGPGIGDRGARYTPILRGNFAPQTTEVQGPSRWIPPPEWANINNAVRPDGSLITTYGYNVVTSILATGTSGTFSLSPGHIQVALGESGADSPSTIEFPDGASSLILDRTEHLAGLDDTEALALVAKVPGYESGWTLFPRDGAWMMATRPRSTTADGGLVLAVVSPAFPPLKIPVFGKPGDTLEFASAEPMYSAEIWAPQRILVIKGDAIYEYVWSAFHRVKFSPSQGDSWESLNQLQAITPIAARYRISKIHNRYGERIEFSYQETPGVPAWDLALPWGFSATWHPADTPVKASIQVDFGKVAYAGGDTNPSFTFAGSQAASYSLGDGLVMKDGLDADRNSRQFYGSWDTWDKIILESLTQDQSNATVSISYEKVNIGGVLAPTYPLSAHFPGLDVAFTWQEYAYRRNAVADGGVFSGYIGNKDSLATGSLVNVSGINRFQWARSFAKGVTQITETTDRQTRNTSHTRTTPVPTWSDALHWDSLTFTDVVTHPDGKVTASLFVEPVQLTEADQTTPWWNLPLAQKFQTLAHLRHQPREIREYAVGKYTAADLNGSALESAAHKIQIFDRWDVRSAVNETGSLDVGNDIYPTRTQTIDRDLGTLTTEESLNWDSTTRGWKTHRKVVATLRAPDPTDYLGLAQTGQTASEPGSSLRVATQKTKFKSDEQEAGNWIFALPYEQSTKIEDNLGGQSDSLDLPLQTYTYEGKFKKLKKTVTTGALTTTFGYRADSPKLESAKVEAPGLNLSGLVGATYGYDTATGWMNRIQPMGVMWSVQEDRDIFGRIQAQYEANGIKTSYVFDGAGRLQAITPPNGEFGTSITYDPDQLGMCITRGASESRVRFNGFGQVIRETKKNPDGSDSYRVFGYDNGGQKIWESVWLGGSGNDIGWGRTAESFDAPSQSICERWAPPESGGACLSWVTTPGSLSANITRFAYDGRGRLTRTISPDGEVVDTSYDQRTTTRTLYVTKIANVGEQPLVPLPTVLERDPLGRLWRVVDAHGRITEYKYDPADRIARVIQWAGAAGASVNQERTWIYDAQGRLTSMLQPESGLTAYSEFDVNGKPWKTIYGASSPAKREVSSSFDTLGRMMEVSGSGVFQSFTYDEGGEAAYANGKRTKDVDGNRVTRSYDYLGLNGRMSALKTKIEGVGTIEQAYTEYDNYGNRKKVLVDDRILETIVDPTSGLPSSVSWQGTTLGSAEYNPGAWTLKSLGFGSSGVRSEFTYDSGQTKLTSQKHSWASGGQKRWDYVYDGAGRLLADGEDSYTYDALSRLSTATIRNLDLTSSFTQTFTYDAFGNMLSCQNSAAPLGIKGGFIFDSSTPDFSALQQFNQLPKNATTGAFYDPQGNLTKIYTEPAKDSSALDMTYDALGRVISMTDHARGITEKYFYTAEGLRTVIEEWSGTTLNKVRIKLYNDSRQVVSEYESVLGLN